MPKAYSDGTRAIARKIMEGAPVERTGLASFRIDAAGSCEKPVGFTHAYGSVADPAERARRALLGDRAVFLDGDGRCRRCGACLAYRRRLWAGRAAVEVATARRTWWGTLTQRPAARAHQLYEAQLRAYRSGVDYDGLPKAERYARLVSVLGGRFGLYMKRLRKAKGVKVRYLLVAEPHKNGDPHLHVLLHEMGEPIAKSVLEKQWTDGFSSWRLVEATHDSHQKVAWYITKYMLKAEDGPRLRASFRYGSTNLVEARALPEEAPLRPVPPEGGTTQGDELPSNNLISF